MAIKNDITVVDIIPVFENEDVKKIYDHGIVKFNQIILSIFNQIQMQRGTLIDFPDIGCMESLLSIHFSESQYTSLAEIRENISRYRREQVSIDIIRDEDITNPNVSISISVENIPNFKFTADIVKNNNYVKIVNPQVLEV